MSDHPRRRAPGGTFLPTLVEVEPPPPAEPSPAELDKAELIKQRKAAHKATAESFRRLQKISLDASHERIQQLRLDSKKNPRL